MRSPSTRRALLAAALAAAALVLALPRPSAAGEGFVVVVNEKNPVDHIARGELSQIFLKRTRTWADGRTVAACDLSATHPVRAAFSMGVHHKPAWYVVGFWQQEIAAGRMQPPKVYGDEESALSAVRTDAGAVAYVGEEAALGPGLKKVALTP